MSRSRTPVKPELRLPKVLKTTTAASGANWVKVGNAGGGPDDCMMIDVDNTTGTTLEFGFGAGEEDEVAPVGETFRLGALSGKPFWGMTTSERLFVRRLDQSNSQVTFYAISYA